MFLVNSRLGLFSAASFLRHPLSLSYGVILPSSLTTVLSLALGYSPHPPVSVCGTGTFNLDRDFSRQCEISCFATKFAPHRILALIKRICLSDLPQYLDAHNQQCAQLILLCHPFSQTIIGSTGISTCCPSPTPFGLSLGPD